MAPRSMPVGTDRHRATHACGEGGYARGGGGSGAEAGPGAKEASAAIACVEPREGSSAKPGPTTTIGAMHDVICAQGAPGDHGRPQGARSAGASQSEQSPALAAASLLRAALPMSIDACASLADADRAATAPCAPHCASVPASVNWASRKLTSSAVTRRSRGIGRGLGRALRVGRAQAAV